LALEKWDDEIDMPVLVGLGVSDPDPGQEEQYLRNMCLYLLYGPWDATFSTYGNFDSASFIVGGPSAHRLMKNDSLIITEDMQEERLDSEELIKVDGECCHQSWTSLTCKFEPRQVDMDGLVWEDCAEYGLCTGSYQDWSDCQCSCHNGHVRMGNDDGWTYPLDQASHPRVSCNEFSFPEGETDPMFKDKENRCQCGHKAECHDVSTIKPSLCGHGSFETVHSFGFHCPTDQTSLTIYTDTDTEDAGWFPFVQIDCGTKTTMQMLEVSIPVPVAAGDHTLSFRFPNDVPFKLEFLELVDTDCVFSEEVLETCEEHETSTHDKLNQYRDIILIVLGVVLLSLCLLCFFSEGTQKVKTSRHPL